MTHDPLDPQDWVRDAVEPCVSLGAEGAFDDEHIFAPCVDFHDGGYRLWYCGSRGAVADRVFRLGLATSTDGIRFTKHPASPVLSMDGARSVLTPTVLREGGRLQMWFSSADLTVPDPPHTLHEATSDDGITWSEPSGPLLDNCYAPTVLYEQTTYHMWYTDVSAEPWCFRHAAGDDGRAWRITPEPVLVVDQPWETGRLFYPTVRRLGRRLVMWYGSYWNHDQDMRTALGCAVSDDGIRWTKFSDNPVFRPDPSRSWESHYVTSQSILELPGGGLRIWYATRPAPPFTHKYFTVGTARLDSGV